MYNPQLKTFLCVADAGSFNKAAEQMYITAPAVIKQISLLEKRVGASLFQRTRRGLTLTDAGRSLYTDAKYIIRYCDDSVSRIQEIVKKERKTVRIGVSPMTQSDFLLNLWPRVRQYCPDIQIQLVPFENTPDNAAEILKNLGQWIDVVPGVFDDEFLRTRACAALELKKIPVQCALPIQHPLVMKESLTVQDLYGQRFMLIHRGWNSYLDRLRDDLMQKHPQINVVDVAFFQTSVFNECENHSNLMVYLRELWGNVHPLLKCVPVEWDYTIPFGLLHSPEPSPAVKQFLEAVKQVLSEK